MSTTTTTTTVGTTTTTVETSTSAGGISAAAARRGDAFVEGFVKTCVDGTRANAMDAGEMLRTTTLNAAIKSEASATSDLPTLERAVSAMSASALEAIDAYERRSRTFPQLRYEVLEDLSEKKLALEKKIEEMTAPRDLARKQTLKDLMKGNKSDREEG